MGHIVDTPLKLSTFFIVSNVFTYIHVYVNYIVYISVHIKFCNVLALI